MRVIAVDDVSINGTQEFVNRAGAHVVANMCPARVVCGRRERISWYLSMSIWRGLVTAQLGQLLKFYALLRRKRVCRFSSERIGTFFPARKTLIDQCSAFTYNVSGFFQFAISVLRFKLADGWMPCHPCVNDRLIIPQKRPFRSRRGLSLWLVPRADGCMRLKWSCC